MEQKNRGEKNPVMRLLTIDLNLLNFRPTWTSFRWYLPWDFWYTSSFAGGTWKPWIYGNLQPRPFGISRLTRHYGHPKWWVVLRRKGCKGPKMAENIQVKDL